MDTGGIAGAQLLSLMQRYERLQEEADALNGDKGELMKEVEGVGFDKKVFKIIFKRRRQGKDQCDEEDSLVELYERALEEALAEFRARARGAEPEPILARDEGEILAAAEAMMRDPFAAGKAAALQGDDETRDPFPHPSIESADWLRGHAEGVSAREAARAASGKRRRKQASDADQYEASV